MKKDKCIRVFTLKGYLLRLLLSFAVCIWDYSSVFSQVKERISIQADKELAREVMARIEKQAGINFVYDEKLISTTQTISLNLQNAPLGQVLTALCGQLGLRYELQKNLVLLLKRETTPVGREYARVKGLVTDCQKNPLPGVTILLKGTSVGVTTGVNGRFNMQLPKSTDMRLVFSFVGMETQEIKYIGQDSLNVVMEEDVKQMDEVVVNGYQTMKKRGMAGSVSVVKAEDLVFTGTNTLEQALQGQIPGMMVINTSGLTGTRQRVRVRGTSTLLGSAEPIWVVDGIIQEDPLPFESNDLTNLDQSNMDMIRDFVGGAISWLNPNDIETVTVLKDASSTAIYGTRAANGVIVITTKRGQAGRTALNYSGSFNFTPRLNYNDMELMNSKQRVEVSREAFQKGTPLTQGNFSLGYMALARQFSEGKISLEKFSEEVKKLETANTDWFDILFRNAFSHSHSLSISGGNDKATYRTSLGYSQNNNTAKGNSKTSYNGSANVSLYLWDRLTLSINLAASMQETEAFLGPEPYGYATTINRAIPAYNEDGSLYYYEDSDNGYLFNAINELENSSNKNKVTSVNSSVNARWKIWDWLAYNLVFGYSYSSTNGESYYTERSNYIAKIRGYNYDEFEEGTEEYKASMLPLGGELNQMTNSTVAWNVRNQLEISKIFREVHAVNLVFGQEARSSVTNGNTQKTYGYMPDRGKLIVGLPEYSTTSTGNFAAINPYLRFVPQITETKSNNVSFYGTLDYMYDNRYALNFTIRADANNRFGQDKDNRFLPIYSLGLRYNIGSEPWLQGQNILSDMSLRFTYGFQGNVVEGVSPDLIAQLEATKDGYNLTLKDLPAPELKWEKVENIGIGVDWSLFGNKINGTFEWYKKKTTDMVMSVDVPMENGVLSRRVNGGNMKNSGWDLSASFVPIRGKDWFLSVSLNTGKVNNEVNSTIEPTGAWKELTTGNISKDGYPVSSFWAFKFTGLNSEHGGPEFDLSGMEPGYSRDATMYMEWAGKLEPDFTGGINFSLRYKTLSLTSGLYLSTGNQTFLASPTNGMIQTIPSEYVNMSTEWLDRWRKPGDEEFTTVPALPSMADNANPIRTPSFFGESTTNLYPYEMYAYSTARVVDAWYLRCNTINVTYTFPEKYLPKGLKALSMNASLTNPFTIYSNDFKGRDPEVAMGNQPQSRTITFGVNISF